MCDNLLCFLYVLVLLGISNGAIGQYYANQYPYNDGAFIYSNLGVGGSSSNAGGADDLRDLFKNKAYDKGNNIVMSQDTVKFIDKDNVSKEHDVTHRKLGSNVNDQRSTIGQNVEEDKSHNQKHIKSGFHNTYSKDEKGSNSSYYEDSDDHGGRLVYDKRHGVQGSNHDSRYREGLRDGYARDKLDDRYGGYNSGKARDRQRLVEQDQGNRRDYRDRYNNGRDERFETRNDRPYSSPYSHTTANDYFERPEPILNFVRGPSSRYRDLDFLNGHSSNLVNDLPLPLELPPPMLFDRGDRNEGNRHISRHRITIYDDPRDYVGGSGNGGGDSDNGDFFERPNGVERSRVANIYHSPPHMDFARSTASGGPVGTIRLTEEFYDDRDRW